MKPPHHELSQKALKMVIFGYQHILLLVGLGGGIPFLFLPLGGEKIPGEVVTRKDLSHFFCGYSYFIMILKGSH